MTDQHPITPPRELVKEWIAEIWHDGAPVQVAQSDLHLADRAAEWGADTELEACCEWLSTQSITDALCDYDLKPIADDLRAARRPKPPSLKEQALEDLEEIDCCAVDQLSAYVIHGDLKRRVSNIRRALEALTDA